MRIVLDTNVLVAGLLNPNGAPASILNLIVRGSGLLLYDNRILQEYMEVLRRERFGFDQESVDALIAFIGEEGEYVVAEPVMESFNDKDDRAFYEVAVSGKADYLVTGNKTHFPNVELIRSPRELIDEYIQGL